MRQPFRLIARAVQCAILATSLLLLTNQRAAAQAAEVIAPRSRELVVLVHGMGRSSASMALLAWTLKREGYQVLNWGYSSTCCTIAQLGKSLAAKLTTKPESDYERVHFVGHSLGTVIIRWVIVNDTARERFGRVVMLAPPNQGSSKADLTDRRLGRILKPLPELTTSPTSTARVLAIPSNIEVGVIAGKYDGKVSVAETHMAGETAHAIVPASHTFLMLRRDVRQLTVRFLRTGRFTKAE